MTAEITFYTNPMSRGRIVRWMLEEIGVPYKTEILEYGNMRSPEYLAINKMGKVPAIKHGDTIVTESAAICAYLAETFPDRGLSPTASERGAYYRWLFFAAGPVEQAVSLKMLNADTSEKEGMLGCGNWNTLMDALADAVSKNKYIAGDRFTAADVYVGSHIGWGMEFHNWEKRLEFIDYWQRVSTRNARIKADELDNSLIKK